MTETASNPPDADSVALKPAMRLDRRDALVFVALLGALIVVYSGVLLLPYAFMDDYFWLERVLTFPMGVYTALAAQGRPINGIILRAAFLWAGQLDRLWAVRAFTIAETAALGFVFYLGATRAGWDRARAALLGGMACVVPATQVYVAWTTSVPIPLSGILAGTAAILTGWALGHRRRWPALAIAPILVMLAAAIYQPTAMVFCAVASLDLFRPTPQISSNSDCVGVLRRAAAYAAVDAAGLLLALGIYFHGMARYAYEVPSGRDGISHDVVGKFLGFVRNPLVDSLNLYSLEYNVPISIAIGIFTIIGLIGYFRGPFFYRLIPLILAVILVPYSYAPSLLAKGDEWSYRTQIGMAWMVLVLVWLAVNGWWRMIGRVAGASDIRRRTIPLFAVIAAAFMSGAMAAYNTTVLIAWPQAIEQSLLRIELSRPDVRAARRIIVEQPGWGDGAAPIRRYEEFGIPSFMASWVPAQAIHLVRLESDPHPPRLRVIRVEANQGPWKKPLGNGTVVIDMRQVRDARQL